MAGNHTVESLRSLLFQECPRPIRDHSDYIHLEWQSRIYCVNMAIAAIELQELGMQLSLAERLWKDYDLSKRGPST